MDKLKKCPFCGGIARPENNENMKWLAGVPTNYWVRCICCGCETAICDEPEQAAEKWQARVGGLAKINLDKNPQPINLEKNKGGSDER